MFYRSKKLYSFINYIHKVSPKSKTIKNAEVYNFSQLSAYNYLIIYIIFGL